MSMVTSPKRPRDAGNRVARPWSLADRRPEAVRSRQNPRRSTIDVVFEDEALIVINKAGGPGRAPGCRQSRAGTLMNGLLHHAPRARGTATCWHHSPASTRTRAGCCSIAKNPARAYSVLVQVAGGPRYMPGTLPGRVWWRVDGRRHNQRANRCQAPAPTARRMCVQRTTASPRLRTTRYSSDSSRTLRISSVKLEIRPYTPDSRAFRAYRRHASGG